MPVLSNTSTSKEKAAKATAPAPSQTKHAPVNYNEKEDRTEDFLSNSALEAIKLRLRKKHRKDTTKLMVIYGILFAILIWYLITNNAFS